MLNSLKTLIETDDNGIEFVRKIDIFFLTLQSSEKKNKCYDTDQYYFTDYFFSMETYGVQWS